MSPTATPGHTLLPETQWRYLGLQPHSHAKLTRVVDEPALRPRPLSEMKSLKLAVVGGADAIPPSHTVVDAINSHQGSLQAQDPVWICR